ncbi:MAG: hypothetical protein ACREVE_10670, partial [Gammaproteobacteria bacterium]
ILTRTLGDANGGTIAIRARDLKLSNGAQIFSGIGNFDPETDMVVGSPTGDGTGGDLVVTVGDTISLSGVGPDRLQSGLFASAQTGQGDGGDISVSARNLNIADTAMIESATRSDAQGNAGDIVVSVGRLTISSGGSISTESTGNISGDAGGITIKDADVVRLTNGSIDSAAVQSGGGNIVLRAGELVDLVDSRITTSVRAGEGRGGDITIDPRFVVLDDSQIRASADRGRGGDITIVAGQFFQTPDSIVDASSEENIDGTVVIDSPDTDLTGSITRLPASFLNAAALLSERCAARDADEASSFVIVGRGVPRGPEDWALSSYGSYGRSTEAKNAQTGMDKERRSQTPDDGSSPKDSRPTATLENPALAMIKVSCGR